MHVPVSQERIIEPAEGIQDLQQVLVSGIRPVVLGAARERNPGGIRQRPRRVLALRAAKPVLPLPVPGRFLRENVPHATVLQGDPLEIIPSASFDVLIANLPHVVTESLIKLLPTLSFRTAVIAVSESTDLGQLGPAFSWSEVTRITGDDFAPPQPSVSRVVRVVPTC